MGRGTRSWGSISSLLGFWYLFGGPSNQVFILSLPLWGQATHSVSFASQRKPHKFLPPTQMSPPTRHDLYSHLGPLCQVLHSKGISYLTLPPPPFPYHTVPPKGVAERKLTRPPLFHGRRLECSHCQRDAVPKELGISVVLNGPYRLKGLNIWSPGSDTI